MSTMVHQRPPSPAPDHLRPHQLQHLVYHNGNPTMSFAPELLETHHQLHSHGSPFVQHPSQPGSLYNSPAFAAHELPMDAAFAQAAFGANGIHAQQYADVAMSNEGLGIQYQQFGSAPQGNYYHATGSSPYEYLPAGLDSPVSSSNDTGANARRSRNGRSVARSSSPYAREEPAPRTSKSPKGKKQKAPRSATAKTPRIDKPLSELTKDMDNIPVRNMQEWVNRSVEVRQKEVEKRNGYVTRPMNSFMLYRSAYAERTKQWCLQNNHQIVSAVSGESWPMEPKEIRDHYNDLARQERDNHARAHPSYKFSPSKTSAAAARKKKGFSSSDDEEEFSEPEQDADGEWVPGRGSRNNVQRASVPRRQMQETFPAYSQPMVSRHFNAQQQQQPQQQQQQPQPMFYNGHMAHPGLYQQVSSPMTPSMLSHAQSIEDVRSQALYPDASNMMPFGVPSPTESEFFSSIQQQLANSQAQPLQHQVDPALLSGGYHGGDQMKKGDGGHEEGIFGMDHNEPGQFEHWMDA